LATSIVDALKAQGHILVVKGGSTPLIRELDEEMASHLDAIVARIVPRDAVGGEVTSTFGNEAADEAVEELVEALTRTLMDSDHVEDVFAEDNVIQRDIVRIFRDTLLRREEIEPDDDDEQPFRVRLDTLGYVASTVGKRAAVPMLLKAMEHAAADAQAQFASYNPQIREATFLLKNGGPDRGLELEEAVADQLSDLVDEGLVELPTIERTFTLSRDTTARERALARPRVEVAAAKTIFRSGCAATWELTDPRTVRVTFTPLSEHDASEVDQYMPQFARDVIAIFAKPIATESMEAARSEPRPPPSPPPAAVPAPRKSKEGKVPARPSSPGAASRARAAEAARAPEKETPAGAPAKTAKRTVAKKAAAATKIDEPRPSAKSTKIDEPRPSAKSTKIDEPRPSAKSTKIDEPRAAAKAAKTTDVPKTAKAKTTAKKR
jgi:hypothetical protein